MKTIGNVTAFLAVLTLFMGAAQLMQFRSSVNDARASLLTEYIKVNPEHEIIAKKFKTECLDKNEIEINYGLDKSFSIVRDCGYQVDANTLADLIKRSDDSFVDVSFPLSLFVSS